MLVRGDKYEILWRQFLRTALFFGHGGMFIMGLIFLAVLITAFWLIVVRKKDNKINSSSAFEILQERLARGEITADEFSKLKKNT